MDVDAQTENGTKPAGENPAASTKQEGSKRERSTIEFPYTNLEEAEAAARAIFKDAGTTELTIVQTAHALDLSAASSGFRVKLSALKLFGLIEGGSQHVSLTELGRAIAEDHTAEEARVRAFLRVPLYKSIVEQHEGHTLPPPAAFEREIASYGVAQKAAERARQVFDRSAKHAGFLKAGTDRFVTPIVQARQAAGEQARSEEPRRPGSVGGGWGEDMDPLIRACVEKIPPTGTQWPLEEQVQLLQVLAMAFNMTYKNKRPIRVSADPEPPAPSKAEQ